MVVIGPAMMETILAAIIRKEAGIIIFKAIIMFTMIAGQTSATMGATLIFTGQIILIMLSTMLSHQLSKGENIQLLLGKTARNTIFRPCSMTISLHPLVFKLLLQDPMLIPLQQLAASLISLYLKMISQSLCRGMRLIDTRHQEKMVLMYVMRHTCGTHIVPSFKILECGLSCKTHITGHTALVFYLSIENFGSYMLI